MKKNNKHWTLQRQSPVAEIDQRQVETMNTVGTGQGVPRWTIRKHMLEESRQQRLDWKRSQEDQ